MMGRSLTALAGLVVLALVSLACGTKKRTTPTSTATTTTDETTSTLPATVAVVDISGTWATDCASDGNGRYERKFLAFASSADAYYDYIRRVYSDATCSTSSFAVYNIGSYALGAGSSSPENGTYLKFTVGGDMIMPFTDSDSTFITSVCGKSFPKNVNTSSTGLQCTGYLQSSVSDVGKNVVVLSGGKLLLGEFTDCIPGVKNSGTVPTSTSWTFTKL
jgi:hypothetical protein